jgi:hypothetical protein
MNREKSDMTAKKIQDFLGFTFNTKDMRISVPKPKLDKILQKIRQILRGSIKTNLPEPDRSPRENYSHDTGDRRSSVEDPIPPSLLSKEPTQPEVPVGQTMLTMPIRENGVELVDIQCDDEEWITDHHDQNLLKDPAVTIHVDASDTGWGITSSMMELSGFWDEEQSANSINVRELWTVSKALQSTVQNTADRQSECLRTILQH